ncbi:PREDICTED: uncharacterized protein LOC109188071 [Ipomoea nil]|uniref:uncharacterized protein LOC109188071 n=1 Tax=Ipomoea nil TaxID=35883 RepID=UPI0009013397|nr:PREDICTED: uncharacterized protein LOC109188071 [Ipomoea nil]
MRTVPCGVAEAIVASSSSSSVNVLSLSLSTMNLHSRSLKNHLPPSNSRAASSFSANIHYPYPNSPFPLPKPGACRASQVAELIPSISPEIVVREARLEDCWGVAETHCSSFFPNYSFPINVLLRMNKLIGLVFGFSVPNGCKKTCLVAVTGSSEEEEEDEDALLLGSREIKTAGFNGRLNLSKGYVTGILTLDTLADFLPRKGPLQQRRSGIAYISNVAVRENLRRKGIAKKLVAKAESQARTWGCRAIALHCDTNNPGATKLYMGRGFRIIKVPEGANWPLPRASRGVQFSFMMKLLDTTPR